MCLSTKGQGTSHYFTFDVNESSAVIIGGSTNINNFNCTYQGILEKCQDEIIGRSNGLNLFFEGAKFVLIVKEFDCENSLMTKEFGETLKAEEFPEIIMEITKLSFKDKESFNAGNTIMKTHMRVTAAGKSRNYVVNTTRTINGNNTVSFTGSFDVLIEDFDLEPPTKAFGLVKVNSELNINYSLVFGGEKTLSTSVD